MRIKQACGSVGDGDPTIKRIEQTIAVVTGSPADKLTGVVDHYDLKGDVIDALADCSPEIAKSPEWYIVDVESDLIGSFRGVFSTTEVIMTRRDLSTRSREEIVRIARSARGMWADREDLGDTVEYVNRLRASWERRAEDLGIA
jgi:hypothetical protein